MSLEIQSKGVSDITDSLEIHSNVMRFQSKDPSAPLELIFGKAVAANNVNLSKLKGHNLSPHTMRHCLPSFLLQIYANPCLYWLHQPAFYVLLQKLNTTKEKMITEMERLKRIFSSEFVTRKTDQNLENIVDIMNSINATENDELVNLLQASILPFVYCYFNVVEVIKEQVGLCSKTISLFTSFKYFNLLFCVIFLSYQQSH